MPNGHGPVWAIVVAAGDGSRYGGPKQFEQLAGERVVDRAVAVAHAACDGVVLVVPPDRVDERPSGVDRVVAGGVTRSASVRAGLSAVPGDAAVVVVHDGARPLAGVELFHRVVAAVREGAAGAVPGIPVSDTLKQVGDDGTVLATVERTGLVAVQTPQAFAADQLRSAHRAAGQATDDAGLVEAAGGRVVVVTGDRRNVKITEPGDLELVEGLVRGGP
jgi:2-C-methyl-D-erythritol 4-phosphate cytidylyltransferase